MPPRTRPLTPAELAAIRMTKYRHRRRQGLLAVRTAICPEAVTELIEEGWLPREKAEDPVAVGNALAEQINARALDEPPTQDID